MKQLYSRLLHDTQGQDLIEYGLLLGLIAVGVITVLPTIAGKVAGYFTSLEGNLP